MRNEFFKQKIIDVIVQVATLDGPSSSGTELLPLIQEVMRLDLGLLVSCPIGSRCGWVCLGQLSVYIILWLVSSFCSKYGRRGKKIVLSVCCYRTELSKMYYKVSCLKQNSEGVRKKVLIIFSSLEYKEQITQMESLTEDYKI